MEFELITDVDGFTRLEDDWNRILKENGDEDFYLGYDWFYSVIHFSRFSPKQLFILVFRSQKKIVGIIPGCIRKRRFRIYPVRSFEIIGNSHSPKMGCAVARDYIDAAAVEFISLLIGKYHRKWDILHLEFVDPADRFMAAVTREIERRGHRFHRTEQFQNVVTRFLTKSCPENYFSSLSRNWRRNIVKGINKLNRLGGFDVILTKREDQDIEKTFSDYRSVYRHSWKDREKDPEFHRLMSDYLVKKGILRFFLLYMNSNDPDGYRFSDGSTWESRMSYDSKKPPDGAIPVAGNIFVRSGQKTYFLKSCYRDDYAKYSPGTVLTWFCLKYLMENDGCRSIDFQKGDDAYKFRWGGKVAETFFQFKAENPRSPAGKTELIIERIIVPKMKKMENNPLGRFLEEKILMIRHSFFCKNRPKRVE